MPWGFAAPLPSLLSLLVVLHLVMSLPGHLLLEGLVHLLWWYCAVVMSPSSINE
jgi:hypothetical protein